MAYGSNYTQNGGTASWQITGGEGWAYITMASGWDWQYPPNDRLMIQMEEGIRIVVDTNNYVVYDQWVSGNGSRTCAANSNIAIFSDMSDPIVRRESSTPYVNCFIFDGTVVGVNTPLSGAIVTIKGISKTTGSDGRCLITLSDGNPGTWNVTKTGYASASGSIDPNDTGPSSLDVGLEKTGGGSSVRIPRNGSVRASISWEITSPTPRRFYLVAMFGKYNPGTNTFNHQEFSFMTVVEQAQSRYDLIDTWIPPSIPTGLQDAYIVICDTFDYTTGEVFGVLDSRIILDAIEIY